jgi:hypothetical protein
MILHLSGAYKIKVGGFIKRKRLMVAVIANARVQVIGSRVIIWKGVRGQCGMGRWRRYKVQLHLRLQRLDHAVLPIQPVTKSGQ